MKQEEINKEVVVCDGPGIITRNGMSIGQRLEHSTLLYLAPETETVEDEDGNTYTQTRAFVIEVPNPVTRAMAIDAAERAAYGLRSADDVASFNAALARKARQGVDPDEVSDHDQFIGWAKRELSEIGY